MADRYSINRFVCDTPSGALYEGMDNETHKKVLINRLFSETETVPFAEWESSFRKVLERSRRVKSRHIIETIEGSEDGDGPFFVMKYKRAVPILKAYPEAMRMSDFLDLAVQSMKSLRDLHSSGFHHGGIGPESFLVTLQFKKPTTFKLYDLFLAELTPLVNNWDPETFIPSHPAMQPPEFFTDGTPSVKGDVYMLGRTLYYFLLGSHPFVGMELEEIIERHEQHLMYPIIEIVPETPKEISDMIELMTSPDLDSRPENFDGMIELVSDLRNQLIPS